MNENGRRPSVAVIGAGYVGLTSAACLTHLGLQVTAIDIDAARIDRLNAGSSPIMERGLDDLIERGLVSGRLTFTTGYQPTASADIVLLCLPTPHGDEHSGPDIGAVRAAVQRMGRLLRPGAVVVTKSTVPVGTHRLVDELIGRKDVAVASNPEFLREGSAVNDFLQPDRIVIGADRVSVGDRVAAMYDGIDAPIIQCDPLSAELVKYAANTFLATRLSFVNELSRLCDHIGADVESVLGGIGADSRIGSSFLAPGPGWGGSCFPKDTRALMHLARRAGHFLPVVESAFPSNQDQLTHVADRIRQLCPTRLDRARIAVWGATFKAGTDDTRDSPALAVIEQLLTDGATVSAYDPAIGPGTTAGSAASDAYSACDDADLLVVLTDWPEFAEVDLAVVAERMAGKTIYDTRRIIDTSTAFEAGLDLVQLGRPSPVR